MMVAEQLNPETLGEVARAVLNARLVAWGHEYGGSRYDNIGFRARNLIATLMEFGGFVPDSGGFRPVPIRTEADEIEGIVNRMERTGYYQQAQVLRCDYFAPRMAIEARLQALRQVGVSVSRAGYYQRLAEAKTFVAGAL